MADEFDQYARKLQTSDTDEFAQYARPSSGDFSGKYPTQPDHKDEGFIAHATKTIRDLPDAFLSGRMVSGPLESLRDSMGSFVQNPTLHNSIRAIPGVAMAEDAITQPYRTARSGDTAGAFGDAADIGAQLLGLRAAGIKPAEPLRAVQVPGESAALPKMNPVARMLVNKIPVAGHMLTGAYDVAQERGMAIPGRAQSRIYGPAFDASTSESPTVLPPSGTMGKGPQVGFSNFQRSIFHDPVDTNLLTPTQTGATPGSYPRIEGDIAPGPEPPILPPSGTMGVGPQAGFSDFRRPVFHDPVNTNLLTPTRTGSKPGSYPSAIASPNQAPQAIEPRTFANGGIKSNTRRR